MAHLRGAGVPPGPLHPGRARQALAPGRAVRPTRPTPSCGPGPRAGGRRRGARSTGGPVGRYVCAGRYCDGDARTSPHQ
eukprot:8189328-Heterocapsa_arctica.AAC.1